MKAKIEFIGVFNGYLYLGNNSERLITSIFITEDIKQSLENIVCFHTIEKFETYSEIEESFYGTESNHYDYEKMQKE
jgi:hypothetical protein